jgi:hypothetical protein
MLPVDFPGVDHVERSTLLRSPFTAAIFTFILFPIPAAFASPLPYTTDQDADLGFGKAQMILHLLERFPPSINPMLRFQQVVG